MPGPSFALAAAAGFAFGCLGNRALDARRAATAYREPTSTLALPLLYAAALAMSVALNAPVLGLAALTLVEAARSDLAIGRIPNEVVAASASAAIGLRMALDLPLAEPLAAGVVAVFALLGVRALGSVTSGRPGMGLGDVKLAGALGLLLGWPVFWVLYLGAAIVAVVAIADRLRPGLKRSKQEVVPFAPFIAGGAVLAALLPVPW